MGHQIIRSLLKIISPLSIVLLMTLNSCYFDNAEQLYPNGTAPCDTSNVTYSNSVLPVINQYCISCHGGSFPQGNIFLDNYTNIALHANIPAGQPGSLYGAISHNSGNFPMPQGGNQLSACIQRKIKIWIDAGAPEN